MYLPQTSVLGARSCFGSVHMKSWRRCRGCGMKMTVNCHMQPAHMRTCNSTHSPSTTPIHTCQTNPIPHLPSTQSQTHQPEYTASYA